MLPTTHLAANTKPKTSQIFSFLVRKLKTKDTKFLYHTVIVKLSKLNYVEMSSPQHKANIDIGTEKGLNQSSIKVYMKWNFQ